MRSTSSVQGRVTVSINHVSKPVMHIRRRMHPDPGMPVMMVIGMHELVQELPRMDQ